MKRRALSARRRPAQAAAGALLGFCTGYALKQAGRTLTLLIGVAVRP